MIKNANNLNLLRLMAAYMVLYWHAYALYPTATDKPNILGLMSLGGVAVYVFFSISGYLIYKSWTTDPNPWRFLLKRSLRIFPALIVVIILTAFILGPLVSTLPIATYFSEPNMFLYLKNIALYPIFSLPGVFQENHYPNAVNGSIWSLPIEFLMYLVILFMGIAFRHWLKSALMVMLPIFIFLFFLGVSAEPIVFYGVDFRQIPPNGVFFLVGAIIAAFKWEKYLTLSGSFWLVAALLFTNNTVLIQILIWLAIPYLSLTFGLQSSWIAERMKYIGDYSYGVYIYAFPIQQTTTHFLPNLPFMQHVFLDALISLVFAVFSWHFIEVVALNYKPKKTSRPQPPSMSAV